MTFKIHDTNTAPQEAQNMLQQAQDNFGFLPNILGVFAESPAILEGYMTLMGIFEQKTAFTPVEQQIVLLTASAENSCGYCMAAHSTIAQNTEMTTETLEALRQGTPLPDAKLDALRQFTASVVTTRGNPSQEVLNAFTQAGYSNQHVLDVLLGVAVKTMSNYTNHIAETPLDDAFAGMAWTDDASAA